MRKRIVAGLCTVAVSSALAAIPAFAAPGGHTAAEVNTAVAKGVAYIDAHQNANGSFGTSFPVAETGFALVAYGVLANGNFASLSPAYQTHVSNAITFLLGVQDSSAGILFGSWAPSDGIKTYDTGIALSGLSFFTTVSPAVPAAIANGRAYLLNTFQAPPNVACSSADGGGGSGFCGGWNYDAGFGRSDESNTGFAMTGLRLTGGVPAAVAAVDVGWQHHVQQIATNPFAARNDGGGSYQPGTNFGTFSSNANDTGSLLFGLGYDGVGMADPNVAAAIKLSNDILDEYELEAGTARNMVFHTGATEDGTCVIGSGGCDWFFAGGEGGYNYSLFALSKGLGDFIAPSLTDPANWYAKVVDLLLGEQGPDGSFPPDGRDDATTIFATGLAVSSLGLVAVVVAKANPTISTQASSGNLLGAPVRDVATLAGGGNPSGTVTFRLFSDAACTTQVFASTTTLASVTATSDWYTPTAVGTYYWTALYNGDTNNNTATSGCNAPNESVVVAPFQPPTCTQSISGNFVGPVTVGAGQVVCITNARVVGSVTVQPGGALVVVSSQVSRGIVVDNPRFLSVCGSSVSAPSLAQALGVSNALVPVRIGDTTNGCAGNRFAGDVNLISNLAVTIGNNVVSGNVNVNNNGPGNTLILANNINGALACAGNSPPPTNAGQTNTAGSRSGQCSSL